MCRPWIHLKCSASFTLCICMCLLKLPFTVDSSTTFQATELLVPKSDYFKNSNATSTNARTITSINNMLSFLTTQAISHHVSSINSSFNLAITRFSSQNLTTARYDIATAKTVTPSSRLVAQTYITSGYDNTTATTLLTATSNDTTTVKPIPMVSEQMLSQLIFVNYSKTRRPVRDASKQMTVSFELGMFAFDEINVQEGTMTTTTSPSIYWQDEYLQWQDNAVYAKQIPSLTVFVDEIWVPTLLLVNSPNIMSYLDRNGFWLSMSPDGSVQYYPEATAPTFCSIDVTYFPFDEQNCSLKFEMIGYTVDEVIVTASDPSYHFYRLEGNEEWSLIRAHNQTYVNCLDSLTQHCFAGIEFSMLLRRKSLNYVLTIIVPAIILSVAEGITFYLPKGDSVKNRISVTCMLAYVFLQTAVGREMPNNSEKLPFLSIFLALETAYIGLAFISQGIVVLCIHNCKVNKVMPRWLRILTRTLCHMFGTPLPQRMEMPVEWPDRISSEFDALYSKFEESQYSSGLCTTWDERLNIFFRSTFALEEQAGALADVKFRTNFDKKYIRVNSRYWRALSRDVDRIGMLLYFILIVGTPVVFFLIPPETSGLITRPPSYRWTTPM